MVRRRTRIIVTWRKHLVLYINYFLIEFRISISVLKFKRRLHLWGSVRMVVGVLRAIFLVLFNNINTCFINIYKPRKCR